MPELGIGSDGYFRIEKETVYGTPVNSAMILLPVKSGSFVNPQIANIENANVISKRQKQAPCDGRKINPFAIIMDDHPSLVGLLMNWMFGAASSAAVGDGAYIHHWLQDLTNQSDGSIFTIQSALGSGLAEQLTSGMIFGMTLESDSEGNAQLTFNGFAKDHTTDIARISSLSYPAFCPYNFGNVVISEAGLGVMDVNSMSLEFVMGYTEDRYKLGDPTVKRNVFQSLPQVNMTLNVDADNQFLDASRAHTEYDFAVTLTSPEEAGTTPTPYQHIIELPGCRISPEASVEHDPERLVMDLEFDCSYGGLTTNSGADNVMYEVRSVDDTAAYAA